MTQNSNSKNIQFHYNLVFLMLMILLALTFGLAHIDLGRFNLPTGLLIAAIKAILVALYFMHLKHSSGVHRIASAVGVFWLGILISLSLSDYLSRNWLLLPSLWP